MTAFLPHLRTQHRPAEPLPAVASRTWAPGLKLKPTLISSAASCYIALSNMTL
jgi:hypothetical protein